MLTTATYTTTFFGDEYTVEANFAEASSPVRFGGEPTPYQVADFRHSPEAAMRQQLEQAVQAGGDDPEEFADEINEAVEAMR